MHGTNLTKGPIRRQLWNLAWPLMLSVFFHTLYNTVDAFWVGKISPEAIAAVSISQITLFITVAFSMGITVGSGVVMAMHIGANEMEKAKKVLGQSFVLSAVAGVASTALLFLFRDPFLRAAGATGTIFPLAVDYFNVIVAGAILIFIMFSIVFAFNSQGDTKTVTKLFAASTIVNTILDPLLIFGWLGFPALGIKGAAIATLISQALFIAIGLYVISRPSMMVPFSFRNLSLRIESVKRVVAIGFPAAITNAIGPFGIAFLTFITSQHFSEAGAVAASIGFRVQFFAFLPAIGFGFGGMAMLGQNIGAKKFARARESFRTALTLGSLIAASFGLLIMALAVPVVAIFTSDPVVARFSHLYLWIVPLSYAFLAATIIEATAFQGIGKSWPGFWISFLNIAAIVVLSYLLLHFFASIVSIWVAVAVGYIIAAILGYFWISRVMKFLVSNNGDHDGKRMY